MRHSIVSFNLIVLCANLAARQASPTRSNGASSEQRELSQLEPARAESRPQMRYSSERVHQTTMEAITAQQQQQSQRTLADDLAASQRVQQHQQQQQARAPLRVDKRSWLPRASRTQDSSNQDEAVSLLLEEVASLDIDTAGNSARRNQDDADRSQPATGGGRVRSNIASMVASGNSSSGRGGGQTLAGGSRAGASMPPYRVGALNTDLNKRTNSRAKPCFFNAIACF